jgi:hypothetical protein
MTPQKLGGADDPRNRVEACRRCAASKRTKTSEEYRTVLAEMRGTVPAFYGESTIPPRCPRYPHDGDFAFTLAGRTGTHALFPCEPRADLVAIPGWTDVTADARGSTIETTFTSEFLVESCVVQARIPVFACVGHGVEVVAVPVRAATVRGAKRGRRVLDVLRAR